MKKSILERFISKYSLGGSVDSVTIAVKDSVMSTLAITSDQDVVVSVETDISGALENGSYSIFDTGVLKSLLNVLGDTIDISVQKAGSKAIALNFKDMTSSVSFVLSDPTNIPREPKLKYIPEFDNSIILDSIFCERFIKSKSALPDVDVFTFMSDGQVSNIVLGYSTMNTNRVTIKAQHSTISKTAPLDFQAQYLKEILVANKEATSGLLEISSEGFARATFDIPDFKVTYYLPRVQRDL